MGYDQISFPIPGDVPYEPTGILHRCMADEVITWCGVPGNRLSPHCLLVLFDSYPNRAAFARARAVVAHYQYCVVFAFGPLATANGNIENNYGLQTIMFHPQSGTTARAHFAWCANRERILLCFGEVGDAM